MTKFLRNYTEPGIKSIVHIHLSCMYVIHAYILIENTYNTDNAIHADLDSHILV